MAYCEALGILAVGSYLADITGQGTSAGAIDIYTGSNIAGWTWNNRLSSPNISNNFYLGTGVGISGDGSIIVGTTPGPSGFNTYSHDGGVTYTLKRSNQYPDVTSRSGSPNGVVLNNDGTTLFIGDVDYGVGSDGRVLVYDWDEPGFDWVLRQEIPRPSYLDIGAPGSGVNDSHKFGQGISTTDDLADLLITIPFYSELGVTYGMICFYRLNPDTNLYEFCNYIVGDKDPGWGSDVDLLWNDTNKRFYTGTTDYPRPGGDFGQALGTVYEYNGTLI